MALRSFVSRSTADSTREVLFLPPGMTGGFRLDQDGRQAVLTISGEEAKRLLENGQAAGDEISAMIGYDNAAFFRRLFKRRTGLTPSQYRRMFRPVVTAQIATK